MKKIRVGTRDSGLAIAQTELFLTPLRQRYPDYAFERIAMKTAGDMILDTPLDRIGGKGLFIKELDRALLENRIDLAVHSLKDMPMSLADGLSIRVYGRREDPRDALVLPAGWGEPDRANPIGCTSRRRKLELRSLYPEWPTADIRGNVLTRLEKLDRREYGALVLAAAGLKRLGLGHRIYRYFEPSELLPSAGQGTLVIVARTADDTAYLDFLDDPESRCRSRAERGFVRNLDGDCGAPIAAYAAVDGETLTLTGLYCAGDGAPVVTGSLAGPLRDPEAVGQALAIRLLGRYHRETGGTGKVWLVGAGPGDAGLLTLKADRVLRQAEAVVFDYLVGKGVLARIPAEAERHYVGKRSSHHTVPQEAINRRLVRLAALGKRVVRLKGGDPFLFGRGGEEMDALKAAGIPFEAVPGVSSALAAPAYADIPVSHRDYCSQVHIITGHTRDLKQHGITYAALVEAGGTLIFLMGVGALASICRALLGAGLPGDTPGAVIEQGTTAKQRRVSAPVSGLGAAAAAAGIGAPALIIIGGVCSLGAGRSWAESLPLAGVCIGVTGRVRAESRLSEELREAGAEVIDIPTIHTVPIPSADAAVEVELRRLTGRDWLGFTSPTGVGVFFDMLKALRRDIRSLGGVKIGAVGTATASALEERGILADLVPERFSGAALAEALRSAVVPGGRVILPRSRIGGEEMVRILADAGIEIVDIPIYDTLPLDRYRDPAYRSLLLEGLDWLAFTSPSGVEGFAAAFGASAMAGRKALCIGAQTAKAAAEYGMEPHIPPNPDLQGMTDALKHRVG